MHTTVWDRHASIDPYGTAVGHVGDGGSRWANRALFRRTGDAEIERFVPAGVRFRRGLDLGCGPGRHLGALAARADEVVGFDLCAPMRAEAASATGEVANVEIVGDPAALAARGPFDLIWSRLVLQHQPTSASSLAMLDRIAALLAADGVVVIQVVHARLDRFPRVRALAGRLRWLATHRGLPRLPMTALDEAEFGAWLRGHDLRVVSAVEDGGARGWLSRTYVLRRGSEPAARVV
jgi:SAM-dependent methyltransferase